MAVSQADPVPEPSPWPALATYAVLVVALFAFHVHGQGVLADPGMLGIELQAGYTDDGVLFPWEQGEAVPYRYRPLFRWLVLGAWQGVVAPGDGVDAQLSSFYWTFVILSALALWAAAAANDWYLRGLGCTRGQATVGTLLFLAGFPIVFAYDIPVHTREDLLGFALIAVTLGCVARGRLQAASALACLGVWVRETCLLGVLPILFLRPRPAKAWAYYVAPGLMLLIVRVVQADPSHPMPLGPLIRNSIQPALDRPGEAALYAFAAFGALWVAAGLRLARREAPQHPLLDARVVGVAALAVLSTGWILGQVRENRITYLLFPWVVPLATLYLTGPRARPSLRRPPAWVAGGLVLALGFGGLLWLHQRPYRINAVRGVIGETFHLGVAPQQLVAVHGGEIARDLVYSPPLMASPPWLFASRANGPFVIWHLAAAAALLAGAWSQRRVEPCPPSSTSPCS